MQLNWGRTKLAAHWSFYFKPMHWIHTQGKVRNVCDPRDGFVCMNLASVPAQWGQNNGPLVSVILHTLIH